ncbi:uncharacterized protein EDB91DRAFT_1079431 [Suillus paluster]|uniref:uncharacterized protein n=1 Tax=Suillus paluster TaxID=48578 RepID=UPI001B879305|nr:uncharacterized protein EDB91DRAFT_1079431 [Suillus paluster]KAG1748480.1 hypothetical protein EDB91DRAFT_1079431 [Suillus paluster]
MSHKQLAWLSEKMDGFQLSQMQSNVSIYLSEANAQWFAKWPMAVVHFKDETGIRLMEEQHSKEQHVSLGHHLNNYILTSTAMPQPWESHMKAAKAMTACGQEYMKKMELEAKMECEHHAEKVKAELEALCNPNESVHVHFHHGKGSTGLSFCKALPDHHTHMVEPFTTFLKGTFAIKVLPPQPNTTNSVLPDVTLPADT